MNKIKTRQWYYYFSGSIMISGWAFISSRMQSKTEISAPHFGKCSYLPGYKTQWHQAFLARSMSLWLINMLISMFNRIFCERSTVKTHYIIFDFFIWAAHLYYRSAGVTVHSNILYLNCNWTFFHGEVIIYYWYLYNIWIL